MDDIDEADQAEIDLAIALSLQQSSSSSATNGQAGRSNDGPITISDTSASPSPESTTVVTRTLQVDDDDNGPKTEARGLEEITTRAQVKNGTLKRKEMTFLTSPLAKDLASDSVLQKKARIANTNGVNSVKEVSVQAVSSGGNSRAEMERERLARQEARQATGLTNANPVATSSNPTTARLARIATLSSLAPKSGTIIESSSAIQTSSTNHTPYTTGKAKFGSLATLDSASKDRKFWTGVLRPTASNRHSGYEWFTFKDVLGDVSMLRLTLLAARWTDKYHSDRFP